MSNESYFLFSHNTVTFVMQVSKSQIMANQSAGILLYRKVKGVLEFFLVHPGGPFFKNKNAGAWSIPKGEFTDDEEPLAAAKREFEEETGQPIDGEFIALGAVKLKSGKTVH